MPMKLLKSLGYVVSALAVCGVGIVLGRSVARDRLSVQETVWETGLVVGDPFPDVTLTSVSGEALNSRDLFGAGGRVLLFLDPRCPSCREAAARWQELLDAGRLEPSRLAGITTAPPEQAGLYRRELGLGFPVYTDAGQTLEHEYGVTGLPYEVIVGASGRIRSTNVNVHRGIDVGNVRRQLGD